MLRLDQICNAGHVLWMCRAVLCRAVPCRAVPMFLLCSCCACAWCVYAAAAESSGPGCHAKKAVRSKVVAPLILVATPTSVMIPSIIHAGATSNAGFLRLGLGLGVGIGVGVRARVRG